MDFDDLLYYTNVLLRDNPDIRRKYQEYFRYVLVDEYQDTNFAQHVIIRQLCEESKALCVVGDDAQSHLLVSWSQYQQHTQSAQVVSGIAHIQT